MLGTSCIVFVLDKDTIIQMDVQNALIHVAFAYLKVLFCIMSFNIRVDVLEGRRGSFWGAITVCRISSRMG